MPYHATTFAGASLFSPRVSYCPLHSKYFPKRQRRARLAEDIKVFRQRMTTTVSQPPPHQSFGGGPSRMNGLDGWKADAVTHGQLSVRPHGDSSNRLGSRKLDIRPNTTDGSSPRQQVHTVQQPRSSRAPLYCSVAATSVWVCCSLRHRAAEPESPKCTQREKRSCRRDGNVICEKKSRNQLRCPKSESNRPCRNVQWCAFSS